jgi:hypothetical protein
MMIRTRTSHQFNVRVFIKLTDRIYNFLPHIELVRCAPFISSSGICGSCRIAHVHLLSHRSHPRYQLDLESTMTLHGIIVSSWSSFVRSAPNHWHADQWLSSVIPMAVVMRYGQDRLACNWQTRDAEAALWSKERDYTKMRIVSIAIATSLKYTLFYWWPVML